MEHTQGPDIVAYELAGGGRGSEDWELLLTMLDEPQEF